ncbi:hypothetical protein [Desulfopila sp. IMCC35008]|uniref:hypothetical protein n=1 Tax=Desulfopila sp. IMCC35008 TaxID=2653858 RepID=UPI0013CF594E|nr:hypothetical protein [Desulfopila sp. IMCC35008]
MKSLSSPNNLVLKVDQGSPGLFSTLLQSGLQIAIEPGTTIDALLMKLPGFTSEYIAERVQTIFLDGTATDDLYTPISGIKCVLAITTAMPGLAGAIFRKDSHHAALRTTTVNTTIDTSIKETIVTLKLFSALAKERGPGLLNDGVTVGSSNLVSFLNYRPSLLGRIKRCTFNDRQLAPEELCEKIKPFETIHLRVHT